MGWLERSGGSWRVAGQTLKSWGDCGVVMRREGVVEVTVVGCR